MEGLIKSSLVLLIIHLIGCERIDANTLVDLSVRSLQGSNLPELPKGYEIFSKDNVAYKIYEDLVNWGEARGKCISDGGDLAIIDTSEKIDYIKSIYSGEEDLFYVGIQKLNYSDKWTTVENVTISTPHLPWAPLVQLGQNNSLGEFETCAVMKISAIGLVLEEDCMSYKSFVCGIPPGKYRSPTVHTTQSPLPLAVPVTYSDYPNGNVTYRIYEYEATWDDARYRCILDDGDLAVTDTSEKIQYIQNFWKKDWLFVGIYKPVGSEIWETVGKVNLSSSSIPLVSWTMQNHKPYKKYCAAIVAGESSLSAFDCTYGIPFICEIPQDKNHVTVIATTTTITPPKTTKMTSQTEVNSNSSDGYVKFSLFGTAYKLNKEYLTHYDARERCFLDNGHLAIIDSFEKVNFISTMSIVGSGSMHVGIRMNSASFLEWVIDFDGKPLRDLPWVTENPHPTKCAALKEDGSGLEDTLCSNKLQYLCEIRPSEI